MKLDQSGEHPAALSAARPMMSATITGRWDQGQTGQLAASRPASVSLRPPAPPQAPRSALSQPGAPRSGGLPCAFDHDGPSRRRKSSTTASATEILGEHKGDAAHGASIPGAQ